MKPWGALAASSKGRAISAALLSALLASCTATANGPSFEVASPSFAGGAPSPLVTALESAAAEAEPVETPATSAATADGVSTGTTGTGTAPNAQTEAASPSASDGDALPAEMALVPASNPAAPASIAVATPTAEKIDTAGEAAAAAPATAEARPAPAPAQQKRGFFASLFGKPAAETAPAAAPATPSRSQAAQGGPDATVEVSTAVPTPKPETAFAEAAPVETVAAAVAEGGTDEPAVVAEPKPTAFVENGPGPAPAPATAKKRGFFAGLFSSQPASAATEPEPAPRPIVKREAEPEPVVKLASAAPAGGTSSSLFSGEALPGVRAQENLFEISRKSGLDWDDDIDLHEDVEPVQVASAAGLARLAPNGLLKQTDGVDVGCLKPSLVRMLKTVEQRYGKKMIVTSGYRNPERNRRARGARNSLHMYCAAADVQVPGVSKWELAKFVRSMPGRGGVGTYCHTNSVHIDVGPERDWNWRCRRRR